MNICLFAGLALLTFHPVEASVHSIFSAFYQNEWRDNAEESFKENKLWLGPSGPTINFVPFLGRAWIVGSSHADTFYYLIPNLKL